MSESSPPSTVSTQQILMEHRSLLDGAAALESVAEDLPLDGAATSAQCATLRGLLEEFVGRLAVHFEAEVQTSSFDAQNAVMAAQLRELDEEHKTLLAAFLEAAGMARAETPPALPLRELTLDTISAFRDHEAKEDALFGEDD